MYAAIAVDRKMTKSIARACQTDGQLLTESQSQEQAATSDQEAACRLGNVAVSETVETMDCHFGDLR